ncbi:MAG: patatin-like phospholipase family protein [Phycisphaerales bacterium]|nr:patatin-like phospholipase family protein [Phycisphaerales bacterium]
MALQGCSLSRGEAVPSDSTNAAVVPGIPNCRFWADSHRQPELETLWANSIARERAFLKTQDGPLPPADFLVISGGGPDGAYGAGLICAWTDTGQRPEFKVVTGISTGALTAPFAYLGSAYDHVLREVYTNVRTDGIATSRGIMAAIFDDALEDTAPLRKLLDKYVNEEMLKAIAAEYAKGRLLLIGTTNLDAMRPVIWDIGAIASSGDPKALDVVRKILVASAAIPAAFPPVFFDVEVDGKKYQELHVDGGAVCQSFLYPPHFHLKHESILHHAQRDRRAWVIRNARLDPQWASTQRQTLRIAARAISALIAAEGQGDLDRMYLTTRRDGVAFRLAYIPKDFNVVPEEPFDPNYMRPLFERAQQDLIAGKAWSRIPPDFDEGDFERTLKELTTSN